MKPRLSAVWLSLLLLALLLAAAPGATPVSRAQAEDPAAAPAAPDGRFVVRIYYETVEDIRRLSDFDVFEYNNVAEKYFLAAVNAGEFARLQELGFRVEVDEKETAAFNAPRERLPNQVNGIPGYPCYRTVEETYAAAAALAAAHPNLATWIDVGNSWEKNAGLGGYDMMVLKLTNSAIPGPKPKLFVTAAIHAREYTTAELVTRFGETLVNNYGIDPDATWLLDWHEIHLMLQTNPDGRKQAETGLSWRKNTNRNYCGATSTSRGADLNRNFAFQWGCCGGSSGTPCNETYRGPSAASEPETQAVQNYLRAIFPDQRGPGLTDPAPVDATGVYMDIHSYSQLVLWPWGFTSTVPPNGVAMQTLGRKMAFFDNYTPEQAIGLYPTDGTTDDFAYGDLGVAAFTIELGNAFFEACSSFENDVLPHNMPALLLAAKVVRTPYLTPAGPDALGVAASPATVTLGNPIALTATVDDTRYNNTNGTEPTQNIAAAEYYVDVPPWDTAHSPVAIAMAAADGSFNSTVEKVTATVATSGLTPGRHLLFVRGKDAAGNWGAFSAAFLDVTMMVTAPASQAVCAPASASYTVKVGYAGIVSLSAAGNPLGTTATFAPNPVAGPGTSTLTIGNTAAAAAGSYTIGVTGTAGSIAETNTVRLDLAQGTPAGPALAAPANGATGVSPTPTFSWAVTPGASYAIDVATDPTFTNIVASAAGLTATSYTPSAALTSGTLHYWRVRATTACGVSPYTAIYHFRTAESSGDCSASYLPLLLYSQGFESGAGGWTHSAGTGTDTWAIWSTRVHSGSAAFHATDSTSQSDQRLVSPAVALPTGQSPLTLRFWNYQWMESRSGGCYDGGILEASTDGGSSWTQLLDSVLLTDPYDGPFSTGNPLGTVRAWCGDPQDWLNSLVNLDAYAGKSVRFRFRLGSDSSVGREGWTIDDVAVRSCQPCGTPAAVTGAAIGRLNSTQAQVTWNAAAGATYYEVWYAANQPYFTPGADCGNPAPYGCAYVAGTSFTHTALGNPTQNYTYVIRGGNACAAVSPALSGRVGEFDYAVVPGN